MKINYMLSKTINWPSISFVFYNEGGFTFFYMLFWIIRGSLEPALSTYGWFQVIPSFTSDDIRQCFDLQFTINHFMQILLKTGAALMY